MYKIDIKPTGHPTSSHTELIKAESLNQSNDTERKRILKPSPVFESGGKPSKLLSLQPKRDLETYSEKTGSPLRTEKTRGRPTDGVQAPKRESRHLLNNKRHSLRDNELGERKLNRKKGTGLSRGSSYNQNKGLEAGCKPTIPFFSHPVLAFAFITLDFFDHREASL